MTTGLKGRSALITGGGSGIGAAIAERLASAGAKIIICGRRKAELERVAGVVPNCTCRQVDVTDEDAVVELFRDVAPPDIVIANAGAAESAPIEKTDLDLWNRLIGVNLTAAYLVAREGIKAMRGSGWGRIVFISSIAGLRGYPYVSAYCAAKHGVIGLTKALAMEVADHAINVNAICPGTVESPMLEGLASQINLKKNAYEHFSQGHLIREQRITPRDIANAARWLISEDSRFLTGTIISVDAGWSAGG